VLQILKNENHISTKTAGSNHSSNTIDADQWSIAIRRRRYFAIRKVCHQIWLSFTNPSNRNFRWLYPQILQDLEQK